MGSRTVKRHPHSIRIWDAVETIPSSRLTAEIVPPLLGRQLQRVRANSPFYQRKWAGLTMPTTRRRILDLHDRLPFTEKQEVLQDQMEQPPFGSNLAVAPEALRRVSRTSGATGAPMVLALTATDLLHTYQCGARCFYASGLRPGHMVMHCMNYCMWAGGSTDQGSLEATGATVVPFGVGNTTVLIQMMRLLRPDALHSTPSYLGVLKERLQTEFGATPASLGLKLGLFGGEGGVQDPAFRAAIEAEWGFRAMNANYGMADVLSMFGAECEERCGLHFMGQKVLYPALIDPATDAILPLEPGVTGELVLTNLAKEAQPLVRYRTHDMIEILSTDPCACGRTSFRFNVSGRSDDMIVVKGINVFVGSVRRVLSTHLDILTGEFMVLVSQTDPISRFVVRAELRRGHEETRPAIVARLRSRLKEQLTVEPEVDLVDEGTFPRTEGKAKRLLRTLL